MQPSLSFKQAVQVHDAFNTRAVTGNMCVNWGSCPKEEQYLNHTSAANHSFDMPKVLDVQGFSHVHDNVFHDYHAAWPTKPLVASECCSCLTQRGEDDDLAPNPRPKPYWSSLNADCVKEQTQWSDALPFVAGTFVW